MRGVFAIDLHLASGLFEPGRYIEQTMTKAYANNSISELCTFAVLSSVSALLLSACGGAEPDALSRRADQIVAGSLYEGDPQVGLLLTQASPGTGVSICTATLVGKKTAATAAHCVEPAGQHLLVLDDVRYNVE
jgi:hypothetical protein